MDSKLEQKIINVLLIASAVFTLLILIVVIMYILLNALGVISFEFLFSAPVDAGRMGEYCR